MRFFYKTYILLKQTDPKKEMRLGCKWTHVNASLVCMDCSPLDHWTHCMIFCNSGDWPVWLANVGLIWHPHQQLTRDWRANYCPCPTFSCLEADGPPNRHMATDDGPNIFYRWCILRHFRSLTWSYWNEMSG